MAPTPAELAESVHADPTLSQPAAALRPSTLPPLPSSQTQELGHSPQFQALAQRSLIVYALITWVVLVIIRNAWLSDDAYISFRTVNNLIEGRGLTWNPGQRVQAFTHPAWFFVMAAAHALTHEMYYTAIAVGVAVASLGLWLAGTRVADREYSAWPVLVALSFCRAFIDFSTSGLENALSHLLLFSAMLGLVRAVQPAGLRSSRLDVVFGLLVWNRVDLGLLIAPTWLWLMGRRRQSGLPVHALARHALIAAAPIAVWWAFSLFYFGFALPNTAYAKLGIKLPLSERAAQGFFYLLNLISTDPCAALLLGLGLGWGLSGRAREPWLRTLQLGGLLYIAYVVSIGGDFMAGRFLSAPLVAASATLLRARLDERLSLVLCALFALVGYLGPSPPPVSGAAAEHLTHAKVPVKQYRITDERRYYYHDTGLLTADRVHAMPSGKYWDILESAGKRGVVLGKIGMRGFIAGPSVTIIDVFALADPFLARLPHPPIPPHSEWTVGHFKRPLPKGYVESVKQDKNVLRDPQLAKFYDHMQLITTGSLWSGKRLRAIWRLNTGQYDALVRGASSGETATLAADD